MLFLFFKLQAGKDSFPTNEKGEVIFNDDEVSFEEVWQVTVTYF